MTWIRLDPHELAPVGAHLRDVSMVLEATAFRVDNACCTPGLGHCAASLMAEGRSLAGRLNTLAEDYVRQAVDILLRALVVARENALVTSVSTVGVGVAPLVGGTVLNATPPAGGLGGVFGGSGTFDGGASFPAGGTTMGGGLFIGATSSPGATTFSGAYFHATPATPAPVWGGVPLIGGGRQSSGGVSGPSFGPTSTTADLQNAAAVRRQQMGLLNATSGLGNPYLGYSQAGLTRYEQKFGSGFMGISVKERFG